jgi:prolyl-tRNA synthetase
MKAHVVDESGQQQPLLMGCYGFGVSRIIAAAIEQHHDLKGIILPISLAPFQLSLIPIGAQRSEAVRQVSDSLYHQLTGQGIDVLYDDRNERPGVLFADHELIGIPHRLVISDKLLANQQVEYKSRDALDAQTLSLTEIFSFLKEKIY